MKRHLPLLSTPLGHSVEATEDNIDALVDKLGEIVIVCRGESEKGMKAGNQLDAHLTRSLSQTYFKAGVHVNSSEI